MTKDMSKSPAEHRELHARASESGQIIQVGRDLRLQVPGQVMPVLTTLPPAPAHLVGRAEESKQLLQRIDPADRGPSAVAVSTVAGLAGIGKTALALHTAHEAVSRGWFPGGVLFVTLHGYDPAQRVDAETVLGMLLRGLGVQDLPPTFVEQQGLYQAELASRSKRGEPVLVIADDAGSTSQVLPLVPAHSGHRLLITSRGSLESVALASRHFGLGELEAVPASALITNALSRVAPLDPRIPQEPTALDDIVAHCGGLPLALEIAAALLAADPGQPLSALADQLKVEHTRLATLNFDDERGHSRAVRAAFDLSYQQLSPDQARLLRLLSCNPGPDISTETATALNGYAARPVLAALARANLLREQPLGGGRWRMHDLIRLYTHHQHQKTDSDELRQECLDRLLNHYRVTADAADAHLQALPGDPVPERFTDQADASAWLDAERLNLLSAISIAADGNRSSSVIYLATSLADFLRRRPYFEDAVSTAGQALTAARELGDRRGERVMLNNLGMALRELGRHEEAIDSHKQAFEICRELDDRHSESVTLTNLGIALQEVQKHEEAIEFLIQALAICRELDDQRGEGAALNALGLVLREVKRFEEAIDKHKQALVIRRTLGDRRGEAAVLNNLGLSLWDMRKHEEAIDAHEQDLAICREIGDRHSEGIALNNLGIVFLEMKEYEKAIDFHKKALEVRRGLNDRGGEIATLKVLGVTLGLVSRFVEAIDTHERDLAICRELNDRRGERMALYSLGLVLQQIQKYDEAIDAHEQALVICRELGDRDAESVALNSLGVALRKASRFVEAIDAHEQGLVIFRELNDRPGETVTLTNIGLALEEIQKYVEAIDAHEQALVICR
ncbi:tetratricopeptide repeat protein, partial [Streptomyces cyaneofuscatus]|uniref:tetratricopeptide repeat protein n=1 Tax=Streptomyces cyaneofuscatus TaxID=66883 RepID=UPI0036DC08A7